MPTVLIAAAARLGSITQRGDFPDAMSFADNDALRALEAITRHRPSLVVLESAFAATSRGTALINRIKADPSLSSCELRVVSHVSEPPVAPAGAQPAIRKVDVPIESAPTVATSVVPVVPVAPVVAQTAPPAKQPQFDTTGTRRVPRYDMASDVEVLVDGDPATLIDLSLEGAQIVSPTTLKPNQRLRLTLPVGLVPIRVIGEIAWAMFEMPQSGPRYRAGIAFIDPDRAVMRQFIDTHAK